VKSKYNDYWEAKLDEIAKLLKAAYSKKPCQECNVANIKKYGERDSWYGIVEVTKQELAKGQMAHMKSLGSVLLKNRMLDDYKDSKFRCTVTGNLKLRIRILNKRIVKTGGARNSRSAITGNRSVDTTMYIKIHEILESLPLCRWPICKKDLPENGIYFYYEKGEMIKGRNVERIVRVGTHRKQGRFPGRVNDHFHSNKNASVFRRHVGSALMSRRNDKRVDDWIVQDAPTFSDIEKEVNDTLRNNFSFRWIVADDGVERLGLEKRLISALAHHASSVEWLGNRAVNKKVKRSKLWNDQHIDSEQKIDHKWLLKLKKNIDKSVKLVSRNEKKIDVKPKNKVLKKKPSEAPRVLMLLPCCKRKSDLEKFPCAEKVVIDYLSDEKKQRLLGARKKFRACIRSGITPIHALNRYDGKLYNSSPMFKQQILDSMNESKLDLLIVSAGLGVVHAFEKIPDYDLEMKNKIADQWIDAGLPSIIEDLMIRNNYNRVFGFFAITTGYAKVFQQIDFKGSGINAGFFYVPSGSGGSSSITPKKLGKAVSSMIENNFQTKKVVRSIKGIAYKSC